MTLWNELLFALFLEYNEIIFVVATCYLLKILKSQLNKQYHSFDCERQKSGLLDLSCLVIVYALESHATKISLNMIQFHHKQVAIITFSTFFPFLTFLNVLNY